MHFLQRLDAKHELEGVMTRVVSTSVTFEGTLLNQDTRSMIEQSKVGITRSTVDGTLVLDYEDMFMGKRLKLSRSQCLCLGRIENPKIRRLPNVVVPRTCSICDFERECVMSTGGPSIGLLRTSTSGHAVVEQTSSRIDLPPRCVSNRNSLNNDDGTHVIDSRAEDILVNDLKHVSSRTFFLESAEVLMQILAIGENTLHSESNRFCSHKARSRVDNDRFEDVVSATDVASMGSLEVIMDRRDVREERDVEVVLVDVRICRQKPVVDRVRVERVTRRRVVGLHLLPFIGVDIPSELDRSTPTFSIFVSALEGGHEVFQGTYASNQIGGIHERKEVDALLTGRVKASNLIRALRHRDVRIASGWRHDSVRMTSGRRQDGVRMASRWRQDSVRMRQNRRQNAVRMMGSLASGWRQVASGCVRMASGKRPNSIRMASGSVRMAPG